MPKKFSIVDKGKWLEKYENGKSEAAIASESNCDVRTVRKGLDEARRGRDIQVARSDLIKQALLGHQETLKSALASFATDFSMPDRNWAVLSWIRNGESIFNEVAHNTEYLLPEVGEASKDSANETSLVLVMLKEHLRNDRLWKLLSRRENVFSTHRNERIMLQRKVVSILEEETGYKISDREVPGPFLYSYIVADLFYTMTLRSAFGNHDTGWQGDVITDQGSGTVRYRNSILAEARGGVEQCRKKLLGAFNRMKILPEAARVVDLYRELEGENLKVRRAVEEILALGLVPGQCRVCRRLGM